MRNKRRDELSCLSAAVNRGGLAQPSGVKNGPFQCVDRCSLSAKVAEESAYMAAIALILLMIYSVSRSLSRSRTQPDSSRPGHSLLPHQRPSYPAKPLMLEMNLVRICLTCKRGRKSGDSLCEKNGKNEKNGSFSIFPSPAMLLFVTPIWARLAAPLSRPRPFF